jgi:hypothetical protein
MKISLLILLGLTMAFMVQPGESKKDPPKPKAHCTYKGKEYAKWEQWWPEERCKCTCMGSGKVSCYRRITQVDGEWCGFD